MSHGIKRYGKLRAKATKPALDNLAHISFIISILFISLKFFKDLFYLFLAKPIILLLLNMYLGSNLFPIDTKNPEAALWAS